MNSFRLDTFERVSSDRYTMASSTPNVMVAIRAKRNLRLFRGGIAAGIAAVVGTLWMIIPLEVSIVLTCIAVGIATLWGLGWFFVVGIGKIRNWVDRQQRIVDKANSYGVLDE